MLQAHKRQDEATQRRFETQMELLSEEVERVVPRSHPFFDVVLILAVARKIERAEALAEARNTLSSYLTLRKDFLKVGKSLGDQD